MICIVDFLHNEFKTEKIYTEFNKRLKENFMKDDKDGRDPELSKFASYEETLKIIYEGFFVYAMIWSFGAPQLEERSWFNGTIKSRSQKIKFPEATN